MKNTKCFGDRTDQVLGLEQKTRVQSEDSCILSTEVIVITMIMIMSEIRQLLSVGAPVDLALILIHSHIATFSKYFIYFTIHYA
jgi:hypothetical protein